MLQIYNSLTKTKEPFKLLEPGKIGLYVCGMTVYDFCHIGHARVFVVFDLITRYLRSRGFDVNYVRNITDIDDKIINRAHENNESIEQLTERFIGAMHEDAAALNILTPDVEPCATKHIDEIIQMISTLMEKGYAYVSSSGDVYYSVRHFKNYGRLANKALDDLRSGARVGVVEEKRDPLDFVLWKSAKAGEKKWDSPWGEGRPGWHIECSAMSTHYLGNRFDIHGGGFDLQFPHHENEIAQSEAATGEPFVGTWIHVGFVNVNKEKMSKSLGNFFTIREILDKYPAEVIRYFMISSHYRSPVNYSDESLEIAYNSLERLYTALRGLPKADPISDTEYEEAFNEAMDDDFNVPEAFAVLFEIAHEINRTKSYDNAHAAKLGAVLKGLGSILGILQDEPDNFLRIGITDEEQKGIEGLILERQNARAQKDWGKADEIRDKLASMQVILEDTPTGTTWRKM